MNYKFSWFCSWIQLIFYLNKLTLAHFLTMKTKFSWFFSQSFSKRDFSIFQREFFALSSGLGVGPKFMFYWWIFGVVLDAVLAACLKKMEGGIENNVRRARTTESYAICLLTYVRSNKEILSTLENYSRLYNRHATLHTNVSKHTHTVYTVGSFQTLLGRSNSGSIIVKRHRKWTHVWLFRHKTASFFSSKVNSENYTVGKNLANWDKENMYFYHKYWIFSQKKV